MKKASIMPASGMSLPLMNLRTGLSLVFQRCFCIPGLGDRELSLAPQEELHQSASRAATDEKLELQVGAMQLGGSMGS